MMQRQSAPEHILCLSNSSCLSVFDTSFKGSWRRTGSGNGAHAELPGIGPHINANPLPYRLSPHAVQQVQKAKQTGPEEHQNPLMFRHMSPQLTFLYQIMISAVNRILRPICHFLLISWWNYTNST